MYCAHLEAWLDREAQIVTLKWWDCLLCLIFII